MASEKIPFGLPTAPPMQYYDSQLTAYPPSTHPPPPPQYGTPGSLPPPYQPATSGSVPYGFNYPPPSYSAAPSPGYYHGYPSVGTFIPQPPMPLVGQALYPDVSQLPGSSEVSAPYSGSNSPLSPVRPAPLPPVQTIRNTPASGSSNQKCSFAYLREGEAPPGYVVQWRGGDGLQIFFIQRESHIVSPKKPLIMSIYKQVGVPGSVEGMVEVHGVWRLRLTGKNTPVLHTMPGCYTFFDNTTCPSRVVVLQMPSDMAKKMSADLLDLFTELTDLRNEEGGIVEKVTTGVASVYGDVTQKLNTAVKETVPSAHKNTKWLRKSTGSLVRIGGNLVAKGINLVADHIPVNEKQQQEESVVYAELLSALKKYKKALEDNSVTFVN